MKMLYFSHQLSPITLSRFTKHRNRAVPNTDRTGGHIMNRTTISALLICLFLGLPLLLTPPSAQGTSWEQTSTSDFDDGESFMVDSSGNTITLSQSLTGTWRVTGETANDWFGESVASAGDVNGDGYDDVIVGAYLNDDKAYNAGEAYVYYGSETGLSTTLAWSAQGEATTDWFGYSVAGAGDVNGDGYDDVIVGAYGNDDAGDAAGEVYVFHGSAVGLSSSPDWSDQGEASGDNYGKMLSSAGDITGDGYDDIIVGAPSKNNNAGKAYVYFGSASGLYSTPGWSEEGEASGDYFGSSVSSAADINGDGYGDVVIGAYGNDDGGNSAGEAYVYFGTSVGISSTPGWSYQGESASDSFGFSVCGAGDVNGDGYADVMVGALLNDDGPGDNAGKAYVFHGSSSGVASSPAWSDLGEADNDRYGLVAAAGDVDGDGYDDVMAGAYYNDDIVDNSGKAYFYLGTSSGLLAEPSWSGRGESSDDYFSHSLAGAGDVNGDGYADIIIGAEGSDLEATNAGVAYLFSYGSTATLSAWPAWSDQGEADGDNFGTSVATAGDVNGDGYDDVIVGAWDNNGGGSSAGEAYVYHGSSVGLSTTPDWSDQGEAANDLFGQCVASAGDVNGDGYDDVIVGAYWNDDAGDNAGEVYVYHGSSTGLSTTPDWSDQGEDQGDWYGKSVACVGDINGDGYDDVIVGAMYNSATTHGEAYVYHGSASGLSATPNWSDQGEAAGDYFGARVAGAGDVNGDGYNDAIVSASQNDDGGSNAGETYIYYGSFSGLSTTPDWSDQGEAANDYFGLGVAAAGDVNNDGYGDVIIGAYGKEIAGTLQGKAYVYHGSSSGLSATPDWSVEGEAGTDYFGQEVNGVGDINGDGYDDIIIGAYGNDNAGQRDGKAYIYHGSSSGLSDTLDWSDQGKAAYDEFSSDVAGAGDVNSDGYDDIIVGAPGNDDGPGDNAGEAYVYHGAGYAQYGVYESRVFNVLTSDGVDWQSLSWSPTTPQPGGTSVKVQLGTSDDGSSWDWQGPSGTSTSYYTGAAGQAIYSGDQGQMLKLRFILENDFGKPGDGLGVGDSARTPTVESFAIEYSRFARPSVELSWPNGGENLMHGESYAITWAATGGLQSSNPVKLEYSLNAGSSWTTINSGTDNDGTYLWTLPSNEDVERALVRVTVTAVDGSTYQDTSDASFSIDPPPENPETMDRVISPASGDELIAGELVGIQWQLTGENSVSLYYSTDFGQSWNIIIEDFSADTRYNWRIPDDLTSENVLVKVNGESAEVVSGIFLIGEGADGGVESTGTKAGDSNDSSHVVTGGLTALIIGVLVLIVAVVRYNPKKNIGGQSSSPSHSKKEKKA